MNTAQQAEFASTFRVIDTLDVYDGEFDMRILQETMLVKNDMNGYSYYPNEEREWISVTPWECRGIVSISVRRNGKEHHYTRDMDDVDQIISDLQQFTDIFFN